MTSQPLILASFWVIIIASNLLTIIAGRNSDFESDEELATSPQELIKQIASKTGKAFEINIETDESPANIVSGVNSITMTPQFAYSGERKGIIIFAEVVYPSLNKTIGLLGLLIKASKAMKLMATAVSAFVILANGFSTVGGLLIILAAAVLIISICETLLQAARLIRIRENFYEVHEFYPYASSSIVYESMRRGLNQLWWLSDLARFLSL